MTSLIVIALQRANTGQKERLKENYGIHDENNAKIVKQVNYFSQCSKIRKKVTFHKNFFAKKCNLTRQTV